MNFRSIFVDKNCKKCFFITCLASIKYCFEYSQMMTNSVNYVGLCTLGKINKNMLCKQRTSLEMRCSSLCDQGRAIDKQSAALVAPFHQI